jgi:pimeloyl-ACP methyl ester carboxylesterase
MWDEVSNLEDPLNPAFVDQFVCSFPEALPDEFLDLLVSESLKVPASDRKETLRGLTAADSSVIMNRITAPTLLISADEDAFVSEDQEIIRRAVPDAASRSTKELATRSTWHVRIVLSTTLSTSSPRQSPPRARKWCVCGSGPGAIDRACPTPLPGSW